MLHRSVRKSHIPMRIQNFSERGHQSNLRGATGRGLTCCLANFHTPNKMRKNDKVLVRNQLSNTGSATGGLISNFAKNKIVKSKTFYAFQPYSWNLNCAIHPHQSDDWMLNIFNTALEMVVFALCGSRGLPDPLTPPPEPTFLWFHAFFWGLVKLYPGALSEIRLTLRGS